MQSDNLVSGKKEELLVTFLFLKKIHGKKWRALLRKHNSWHDTAKGIYAWENTKKGTTGNEALRLIISDMQAIISNTTKKSILRKQGFSNAKSI